MKLLIVEDEEPKREAILNAASGRFEWSEIKTANSVRSAIQSIRQQRPDLLLLDMSLPTFDISAGEPGGRPQGEGGIEVLRFLEMSEIDVPTVVVTGYDAFRKKDGQRIGFERLGAELRKDFPNFFKGLVHFDPIRGVWANELYDIVKALLEVE